MSRLRRRAFRFRTAASAVLCLTVCALWAWSERESHFACYNRGLKTFVLRLGSGGVEIGYMVDTEPLSTVTAIARGDVTLPPPGLSFGRPPTYTAAGPSAVYPPPVPDWGGAGFEAYHGDGGGGPGWFDVRTCQAPLWAPAALAAFPPALWLGRRVRRHLRRRVLRRRRRRRLKRHGLCPSCGYDLRATPEEPKAGGTLLARCPECGRVPARAGGAGFEPRTTLAREVRGVLHVGVMRDSFGTINSVFRLEAESVRPIPPPRAGPCRPDRPAR